jgi:hypothetical protein
MMLTWRTAARRDGLFDRFFRWSLSQLRRPAAEPIELSAQHYGYLPARFRHHGVTHRVAGVERIWEQRGRGAQPDRRFFAVRCADARRYLLFQDLRAGTWHIQP